jgi:thiamine biosynthesis protein ThiC
MTQRLEALNRKITKEMKAVAADEGVPSGILRERIASGRVVIPANRNHKGLRPIGIGEGLRIKVNANLGTSMEYWSKGVLKQWEEQKGKKEKTIALLCFAFVSNTPSLQYSRFPSFQ